MAGTLLLRFACAAAIGGVAASGCILDLDGLASGGAAGASSGSASTSGGAAGSSGSSGSGGATGGGGSGGSGGAPACPLLDCSCVAGPTPVAKGAPFADSPRGLALTKDGLAWTNTLSGVVAQAPSSGGVEKLADADVPRAIDVASGTAVWSEQTGLFACSLPSCGDRHLLHASAAPGSIRDVAFDGQTAVWTDAGTGNGTGVVLSCGIAKCMPVTLQDTLIAPLGLDLYGDSAFWVDQGNGNNNGAVTRSPKTSVNVQQISAALDLPTDIAVDDTSVYWTQQTAGGKVYSCPHDGNYCDKPASIAPAAAGFGHPSAIRVAGGRIYWTSLDDGAIRSCPAPGCGAGMPKVHVQGRSSIQGFAVGASCLFWAESGDGGAVMKMPR